ncbi:hypothetical protein WR25_16114 isoform B [Diploscapter pachys]|uniref:Transcription factor 25 n=2 Tax=Diploscapter pachys TaxID=2018661 RepID=A0A2A2LBD9_9BILA|nr:hypothetical protein WR25_16114 isoform B [Diploscapter pachys]
MSTKHLRRLLEEKEAQKKAQEGENKEHNSEDEDDVSDVPKGGPRNRFAFLNSDDDDADEEVTTSSNQYEAKEKQQQKKKKKNKKKGKKEREEDIELKSDEDEDALLERLSKMNAKSSTDNGENSDSISCAELFKVDPKLLDASEELKRALGKAFKQNISGPTNPHRNTGAYGRIVKSQLNWPPIKNIGLSMIQEKKEGNITWFTFVHNSNYEKLERLYWFGEDSLDHGIANEILSESFYHLNSLLMLANVMMMSEDVTQAADLIKRGIFYCEQSFHSLFQPFDWTHRISYLHYENRVFYLLLHRHMLNALNKRCFETSLNLAKLIFKMDPNDDPFALILQIDSIALRARQFSWIKKAYALMKDWKNLHLLPNWRYSIAMAEFMDAKDDDSRQRASALLSDAIVGFPGVVTQLLEELQVQPDSAVDANQFLSAFGYHKEPEGYKAIVKIYSKQTSELWQAPESLSWLEEVTRLTVLDKKLQNKMKEERDKRQKRFVGMPQNIERLMELLGYSASSGRISDPVPPTNGTARYVRNDGAQRPEGGGFLADLIHSLHPDYNPNIPLQEALTNALRNAIAQVMPRAQV